MAPTKSATVCLHAFGSLGRELARLLGCRGRQEPAHQALVEPGADDPADDRPDNRDPEVQITRLVPERATVSGEEAGESRPEVTRGVDRVAGVGAPRHADADHE